MAELRTLKRRVGIAEEALYIKKERLQEAEQEFEEEHSTFTVFSKRLEEKWEQRFDALARLARDDAVRKEDIEAIRRQPWQGNATAERSAEQFSSTEQAAGVERAVVADRAARLSNAASGAGARR